jgi:hypothetical protein
MDPALIMQQEQGHIDVAANYRILMASSCLATKHCNLSYLYILSRLRAIQQETKWNSVKIL